MGIWSEAQAGLKAVADGLAGLGRDDMASLAEARHDCAGEATAKGAFTKRAAELLAPNAWSGLAGVENADFDLFDAAGQALPGRRPAAVGDFVRINLPVFGLERRDWVRVEAVVIEPDRVALVVRPSVDPTAQPPQPGVIAHFFTSEATNTLSLLRDGPSLIARVEGQHERANVGSESASAEAALRHRVLAEAGWGLGAGPQQHQWNRFTANLAAE